MGKRFMLVVGDKFQAFAHGKEAMTVSQLRGLLAAPEGVMSALGRYALVPGQGLDEDEVAAIARTVGASRHRALFDLGSWRMPSRRACPAKSHKHHPRNILISAPRRIGECEFEMDLLIDERCELMDDHQTGQHVQGMVLVEAARQSSLAVVEEFFMPKDGEKCSFVFDEMTVRYKRFVFPLAASLRYTVRELEAAGRRTKFAIEVAVLQGGAEAAAFTFAFSTAGAVRLGRLEAGMAEAALTAHLAGIAAAHEADMAEAA